MSLVTSGILCAAGLSVLELDAAAIGPFLLSRPFVIGPLLGVVLGDIWAGAFFGLVFETLSLSEMPLGGSLKLSAPIAVGVAVWLFLCVPGFSKEAAFIIGLFAGWVHAKTECALRRRRGVIVDRAQSVLSEGMSPRLGWQMLDSLAKQALATFSLTVGVLFLGVALVPRVWILLPTLVREGAHMALMTAPWIACGSLVSSLRART